MKFNINKVNKNKSGIYTIKNIKNGKQYIGSTHQFRQRYREHLSKLKNNKHDNIYLQNSFNKYGEDNFIFEIIEICNDNEYKKIEQNYLDNIFSLKNPRSLYYNIGIVATSGMSGRKHTAETKEKLSVAGTGRIVSAETRAIISKVHKGKSVSNETIEKLRKINYGKKQSNDTKNKLSRINSISDIIAINIYTGEEVFAISVPSLAKKIEVSAAAIDQRLNIKSKLYKKSLIKKTWFVCRVFNQ